MGMIGALVFLSIIIRITIIITMINISSSRSSRMIRLLVIHRCALLIRNSISIVITHRIRFMFMCSFLLQCATPLHGVGGLAFRNECRVISWRAGRLLLRSGRIPADFGRA